jgi:ABC-type oligopeptide transport system substrate-binding subunit
MKALIALVIVVGLLLVACGPKAAPATAGPTGPVTDSEVSSLDSQIKTAGTDVPDTSSLDSIDSDLNNLAVTG